MEDRKEKWEDIIRSKIYDFEADTDPGDWDIISDKLPGGKTVVFRPYRKYAYRAAAAVAALLIVGGLYFYPYNDDDIDTMAVVEKPTPVVVEKSASDVIEKGAEGAEAVGESVEKPVENFVENSTPLVAAAKDRKTVREAKSDKAKESAVSLQLLHNDNADILELPEVNIKAIEKDILYGFNELKPEAVSLDKSYVADVTAKEKRRRWGFGMGGGSYAVGSTSGTSGVEPYSTALNYDEYMLGNNTVRLRSFGKDPYMYDYSEIIETTAVENKTGDVKHKTPISLGFGISYYLNDRWALQSGAVYTLLRSKGNFYDDIISNTVDWKQNLHFVGVPLSLSYKVAEWNRFQFYASAGGMCEFNVAGKLKNTVYVEGMNVTDTENQRMKAPLWSVNTRGGVVYPVWKFINVYAEAGASYYFDNNSEIETIRSDKPFNVSLQAGFRLGF